MEEIVASERTMGRLLALLPAVVIGVCVRILTLTGASVPQRAAAAGVVAIAAWTSYRLLTARLLVDENGVSVRGVFYEAEVPWADLRSAEIRPAGRILRSLVWGMMQPHHIELRTTGATLRPVVAIGPADDDEMRRAVGAIRARLGSRHIPTQRRSAENDRQVTSA
jgi:hypothetical protein